MVPNKPLSQAAKTTFHTIGGGKRLRVPHDRGETPRLKDDPRWPQTFGQVPVPWEVADELTSCGLLTKLTETMSGSRLGWRDMGFTDGNEADYWVCVQ